MTEQATAAANAGGQNAAHGPDNPPRLRKPGESAEDYRIAMGWDQPKAAANAADRIAAYEPGQWFDAFTLDEMQAFYLSRLPAIREAAKEHGYAIGLHGSTRRDFDLMAMPWREGAADKDTLAHAVAVAACGITRSGGYVWEQKSCGRFAVSMPVCWADNANPDFDKPSIGHIDLSVIEDRAAATSTAGHDVLAERRRQVEQEGYDTEHDDEHVLGEIAAYAAYYAMPPGVREWPATETGYADTFGEAIVPDGWTPTPPGNRRRELVKAGALILAEIERIDRATAKGAGAQEGGA